MKGRTFTGIFDDISDEICNNYCKHPEEHLQDKDDGEKLESEHCDKCPLCRLYTEVKDEQK